MLDPQKKAPGWQARGAEESTPMTTRSMEPPPLLSLPTPDGQTLHIHPGDRVRLDVYHDEGCPALHGGGCCCEPETRVTIVSRRRTA